MSGRNPRWWLRVPTNAMRRDELVKIALDAAADPSGNMAATPDNGSRVQSMTKRRLLEFIQERREAKIEDCAHRGADSAVAQAAPPVPERISASEVDAWLRTLPEPDM